MAGRPVTSYDVATRAGVSQGVVSVVLSARTGSSIRVSEATRQRVLETAAELGYTPNHAARSLSGRRTHMITVISYGLDNPYYPDVVRGAQEVAREHGYLVNVTSVHAPADAPFVLDQLRAGVFDGVIDTRAYDPRTQQVLTDLARRGIPAVTTWATPGAGGVPAVEVDVELGGYLATRHLIDLGHARIAHLTELGDGVRDPSDPVGARFSGYRRALREAGIRFRPAWLVQADGSLSGGGDAAERMARRSAASAPTGVVAINDVMALGALSGFRRAGRRVPDDVSVVGFDGTAWAAVSNPPLTTIEYSHVDVGRRAAALLLDLIADREPAAALPLPISLVARESSGRPPQPATRP